MEFNSKKIAKVEVERDKNVFNPEEVGRAEIAWWKDHHEKNYDEVIKHMSTVYKELYDLTYKTAEEIVRLKIEAAKEHDLAEKEGIPKNESELHWNNALQLMIKHFEMLKEAMTNEQMNK